MSITKFLLIRANQIAWAQDNYLKLIGETDSYIANQMSNVSADNWFRYYKTLKEEDATAIGLEI